MIAGATSSSPRIHAPMSVCTASRGRRDEHPEQRGDRERDRGVDAEAFEDDDRQDRRDQRDRVHALLRQRRRQRERRVVAIGARADGGERDDGADLDRGEHVDVRPEGALIDAEDLSVELPLREIEDVAQPERHQEQRRGGRARDADGQHHRQHDRADHDDRAEARHRREQHRDRRADDEREHQRPVAAELRGDRDDRFGDPGREHDAAEQRAENQRRDRRRQLHRTLGEDVAQAASGQRPPTRPSPAPSAAPPERRQLARDHQSGQQHEDRDDRQTGQCGRSSTWSNVRQRAVAQIVLARRGVETVGIAARALRRGRVIADEHAR